MPRRRPMSVDRTELADEVWRALARLVFDHRDGWKRAVIEESGLPFSRIRILQRLQRAPMTVTQLAHAATVDAPAASVAVNDLEERGLIARAVDPADRRRKLVSLTEQGWVLLARIDRVGDSAPAALTALDTEDLETLQFVLRKILLP